MATRKKRATARKRALRKPPARKSAAKKKRSTTRSAARKPAKAARKKAVTRAPRAAKTNAPKLRIAAKSQARKATPATSTARRNPAAAVDASLFPCGDAALRAATGKGWNEWLGQLDASGAAKGGFDHHRLLNLVMQSLPESAAWWAQMISVGYERARGLREKHESCTGDFQSTLSRTFPVPLFAAFAAWADKGLREHWLDAPGLDFTKLNVGKNIRARWPDGSRLDIRFNASGPDKCQIVVDTMKLADAEAVHKAKAFWQAQFERLQAYLRI
jgi:hypothetical protein